MGAINYVARFSVEKPKDKAELIFLYFAFLSYKTKNIVGGIYWLLSNCFQIYMYGFIQLYSIKQIRQVEMETQPLNQRTYTEPIDNRNRILGVSLLLTEIGVMIGYGLAGNFRGGSNGINVLRGQILILILMFIFISVGFGMLLNVYRFANWLGSTAAILVLATSIQLAPLMQKLWISIILTGFNTRNTIVTGTTVSDFWALVTNSNIDINTMLMRITFLSVISLMVVMTSVVGRVGILQIIKLASLYQIFWNINYFLLIYFLAIHQDHNNGTYNPFFFDMFGTTYVYLFAVFFGIPFSCLLRNQYLPEVHPRNEFNRLSLLLSQIGTGFIMATFVFTSCYVINYSYFVTAAPDNFARFSIWFGIIGCVIGTFVGSAIVGGGRVGYKEILVSTACGGVVMGSAAPLVYNIGILLMIGGVTGLFCGIYMRVMHVKVNRTNVKDVLGLFGPFMISSIFGSLIVTPSVIATYYNRSLGFPYTATAIPFSLAGYQLIYVGISAGIGLAGGLLTSIFSICDKDYFALASNSRVFLNQFGLYDLGQASKSTQVLPPPSTTKIPATPGQFYVGQDSNQGLNRSANLL